MCIRDRRSVLPEAGTLDLHSKGPNRTYYSSRRRVIGESEEEEEGAVVDVGVSDSEEELEVLQQPNLIQKLADVVRLRASCVIELSPDHARDSTITVAVLVLNVAARL